jgi:hypothetical protein
VLQDSANASLVFAESENFELRPAGAAPTHEWDPASDAAPTGAAPGSAPVSSAVASPTLTSGAGRLAPGWLVGAAVAAAML